MVVFAGHSKNRTLGDSFNAGNPFSDGMEHF